MVDSIMENREAEYRIIKKTFQNNTDKMYAYLTARGSLDEFIEDIMSDDDDESRELYRMIISSLLNNGDSERLYKYTLPAFNDVETKGDKLVMTLDDKEDLSKFFYNDRNTSSDFIKSLINGDVDYYNGYYDDNIGYEYIIDDLNEENLEYLKTLIKKQCLGKPISYNGNSEILNDIIDTDGGLMTKDGLEEVFRTDGTMADFISNTEELDNIKDNLSRVHNYSEESAIADENYDNTWNAIETFFGGKGEEYDTGRKYKKKGQNGQEYTYSDYDYDIPIDLIYEDVIQWWIDADYNDLDYWGSFENMLEEYCDDLSYGDSLNVSLTDYPDGNRYREALNYLFPDYIDDY